MNIRPQDRALLPALLRRGFIGAAPALLLGCSAPNAVNIQLRKENQDLREHVEQLETARDADRASMRALELSRGVLPTLSSDRLDQLFTTHGLRIGRLTGGSRINPAAAGDDAIKVYVVPTDETDDVLKSAGSFVVEAYDLNMPNSPLLQRWTFSAADTKNDWLSAALQYEFVLTCPLNQSPQHSELTVHVAFVDELTQRRFESQKVVKLNLPAQPATAATER